MNPSAEVLDGSAVRLRRPAERDLATVFDWYNDPEVVAPFDKFSVDTHDEFLAELRDAPANPASTAPRYVIERRSDARLLGFVGSYSAHPVLTLVDVWYVLGERAERGKGYGREAVELLIDELFRPGELERVGATCDVENAPSYRLLERIGFRREGTLRRVLFHHAGWHDVYVYGLTRSERSARPAPAPA